MTLVGQYISCMYKVRGSSIFNMAYVVEDHFPFVWVYPLDEKANFLQKGEGNLEDYIIKKQIDLRDLSKYEKVSVIANVEGDDVELKDND